jgi:Trk-type K+ transport system membrane component
MEEILSEHNSKISAFIILALFFILLGITAASINMEKPTYFTYLFAAITAFTLIGVIGIGHNFVHHR